MKATKIISECELFRLFSLCGEAFSSDEISARLEAASNISWNVFPDC